MSKNIYERNVRIKKRFTEFFRIKHAVSLPSAGAGNHTPSVYLHAGGKRSKRYLSLPLPEKAYSPITCGTSSTSSGREPIRHFASGTSPKPYTAWIKGIPALVAEL